MKIIEIATRQLKLMTDSEPAQPDSPDAGLGKAQAGEGCVFSEDSRAPSVPGRAHVAADNREICQTCGRVLIPPKASEDGEGVEYGFIPDSGSSHFTKGVIGPEYCNLFGDNMDFDMTVLWIAGWYRRLPEARTTVLDRVVGCDAFRLKRDSQQVSEWKLSMLGALDEVGRKIDHSRTGPLSLGEITKLVEAWNRHGCVLRSNNGADLLGELEVNPRLQDCITSALMGELNEDGGSIFTKPEDQCPGWKAINMFRYWSIIGREDAVSPCYLEMGVSMDKINEYLEQG